MSLGGDLYVLKHIIHDWNDTKATQIEECLKRQPFTGADGGLLTVA
jgi:hypothetical protein